MSEADKDKRPENGETKPPNRLEDWLYEIVLEGLPLLSSAEELAQSYMQDDSYRDNDARVQALIRAEGKKSFGTGFVAQFASTITPPPPIRIGIGVEVAAAYVVQVRLAAAIACIYGHDLHDDYVKTGALLSVEGVRRTETLRAAGVYLGRQAGRRIGTWIERIPAGTLRAINKAVGRRLLGRPLLTKTGKTGLIRLNPLAALLVLVTAGLAAGAVEQWLCRRVGSRVRRVFGYRSLQRRV